MSKAESETPAPSGKPQSWWQTLPGILTGVAGIVTAAAGLLAVLSQTGVLAKKESSSADAARAQKNTSSGEPATASAAVAKAPAEAREPATTSALPAKSTSASSKAFNVLSAANGGHLVIAGSDDWQRTIDSKEDFNQISYGLSDAHTAVFAFKDKKPMRISLFTMLITQTQSNNVHEFELSVATESPTGPFETVGKFQTMNAKIFETPYQEFRFAPVVAKYVKVKLLSTFGHSHPDVSEIQLFGQPVALN
jgi:hypothetical protein